MDSEVDGLTDSLAEIDILSEADSEADSLVLADSEVDSDIDSEADSEADSLVLADSEADSDADVLAEGDTLSDIPSIKVTNPLTTVTLFPSKEVKVSVAPVVIFRFPDIVTSPLKSNPFSLMVK